MQQTRRAVVKPQQPQTPQMPDKVKKVLKWLRVGFKIWFWVFTTIAFMLFICEESTQLLGFSRFGYKNIGTLEAYQEWVKACERDKPIVDKMEDLSSYTFWINPISSKVFREYFQQENEKLRREVWIANKLIAQEQGKIEAKQEKDKQGAKLEASFTQPTQVADATRAVVGPGVTATEKPVVLSMRFVYVTKSGSIYHKANCYHLFKDGRPKLGIKRYTKETAIAAGYVKGCIRCKP